MLAEMEAALASPSVALALALGLTLLAILECGWMPWAPYFAAYALLALAIPLGAGNLPFGALADQAAHWPVILACLAAMVAWEYVLVGLVYEGYLLGRLGRRGNPAYDTGAALEAMVAKAERKF